MEFNNLEAQVIEAVVIEMAEMQLNELEDLQLAMVGGGNVIVTCG